MKKTQKKVKYTTLGLANSYKDFIEINYNLKFNKHLRDYIVKHELGHSEGYDILHEFKSINLKIFPSLLWFIIIHPKTWIDFSPIQIKKSYWVIDYNLITLYALSIILCIIILFVF